MVGGQRSQRRNNHASYTDLLTPGGLSGAKRSTAFHSETCPGPKGSSFLTLALGISQPEGPGHVAVDRVHDGASETTHLLRLWLRQGRLGLGMEGTVEPSLGV